MCNLNKCDKKTSSIIIRVFLLTDLKLVLLDFSVGWGMHPCNHLTSDGELVLCLTPIGSDISMHSQTSHISGHP